MWPPEDDVQPARSWDDLVDGSRRRGRRLRRQRRVALAAPVLALAGVLAVPYAATLAGPDVDALVTDTATRPDVVPAPDPRATTGPAAETESAPVAPQVTGGSASLAAAASVGTGRPGGAQTAPVAPARLAPRPPTAPRRPTAPREPTAPGVPFSPTVVALSDPAGDARGRTEDGGAVAAGTESAPSRDILAMQFVAERDGVRIVMELAADREVNDLYYAFLTDASSGCEMQLFLGGDVEGFYVVCGSNGSDFFGVPTVEDPSLRRLEAFVPYDRFPPTIRPERPLEQLRGQSRLRHAASGSFLIDTAETPKTLPGRP